MKHRSIDEITTLVMECRASGLSDHQWCKANNISSSSFYRWVQKLRDLRCDVSESGATNYPVPSNQEVVKLEVVKQDVAKMEYNTPISAQSHFIETAPTIEISMANATMRFSNDVNPELFKTALLYLGGGGSC